MSQGLQGAQYDVFTVLRTRVSNNGLAMMPVAEPYPAAAKVVALNGGLEFDIIAYTAVRQGDWPVVPAPYSKNPNRVYLNGQQTAAWPIDDVSGVRNYACSGFFIFGILAPEGLESDFLLGTVPFPGADPNEMMPGRFLSYTMLNQGTVRKVANESVPNLPQLLRTIRDYNSGGGG